MIFSNVEGMLWYANARYLCCDMTYKSRCPWADSLYVIMGTDEWFNTEVCAYVLHLRQNKKAVLKIHKTVRKLAIKAVRKENVRRQEAQIEETLNYEV